MVRKKSDIAQKQPRPPVVAVVGHVDHGKTTLLDYIREANVAEREAGGITQSVGAYEMEHDGKKITFIDTPGHEAFTAMRARGASIADLAVLVVAATEGIKPQAEEAIKILKESKTPFVVAITKIDAPNADVEKTKSELLTAGVALEGAGGDISWQAVSGKTGEGVEELINLILLVAEVAELTFDPSAHAYGFILEAQKSSRRGVVAHIILKDGVLRLGDEIVTPGISGKVKILEDFLGRPVKEILPSAPALIGIFEDLPKSGDEFWADAVDIEVLGVLSGDGSADLAEAAEALAHVETQGEGEESKPKAFLKADTFGSLEALKEVLTALVEITGASVGDISEGDVQFAKSTGSVVVGFGVKTTKAATNLAMAQKVEIIESNIIYKLVETIESIGAEEEKVQKGGTLEVLGTFSATGSKQTVGGKVVEGNIRLGNRVEIVRGDEVVGKGKIKNLQQGKQDVKEVAAGSECGLVIETETTIEKGDLLKTN